MLVESFAILDALDHMAAPGMAMLPAGGQERREALKVCALSTGLADKAVSLVYEPGSTMKPFIAALAPDKKMVTPATMRSGVAWATTA